MKRTLTDKFQQRWPSWFTGLSESPTVSCLAFGFECGDGWFDLLWSLCEELEPLVGEDFQVHQVKEKFGGLRFYCQGGCEASWDAIERAEQKSYTICEACGKPGVSRTVCGWISTRCEEHNRQED